VELIYLSGIIATVCVEQRLSLLKENNIIIIQYMRRTLIIFLLVLIAFEGNVFARPGIQVCVSIPPQRYFVEKIGGDRVSVAVMVAPGANPATYEPKPKQIAFLANTTIYFAIGVPFEKAWLPRFASVNRDMIIVHTDDGIEKMPMARGEIIRADKREKSKPENSSLDPHIWLSPKLVKIQVENILKVLEKIDPAFRSKYEENYGKFIAEIDKLDKDIKAVLSHGLLKRDFIVFHPSWGYFACDYGLIQHPIEIEGKEPKYPELIKLIDFAVNNDIKVVFVQPQFSKRSAEVIATAIKGSVVTVDPLAENWADNLLRVAKVFAKSMGG